MKIGEYEQMMAYLTRPGFNNGGSSEVVEIDFGSKEDQAFSDMMKAFRYYIKSGGKKSLKDYMRMSTGAGRKGGGREHFRATGGRVNLSDGTEKIVEPSKSMQVDTTTSNPIPDYDITDFRNDAELYIIALNNNTLPKDDIIFKLNNFAQKGVDAGTFTMQEAADAVKDLQLYVKDRARQQRLRDVVPEGIGTIDRENFYAGSSLEQFGSQIKKLYLEGASVPKINEVLGFEKDRTTTIDEFIKSMRSGKAPVKITADELSKRPEIIGTNITGKPGERKAELSKWVKNFKKEEGRLPSMQEAREEFDYTLVKKTGKTGEIKYLPESEARSKGQLKSGQEDILKLSKDSKIRNMFKTGNITKNNVESILNHVRKILNKPNITDDVAGGKIHALAEVFSGQNQLEGIKPTFVKNAKIISTNFPFKARIRDLRERKIGESVGEASIKTDKSFTRKQDIYKDLGISEIASIDEPAGITSSVKKGSTPYAIFAQIINKDLNSGDKMRFDSLKSNYEGKVKNAIENAKANGIDPRKDKAVNKAVKDFNKIVNFYEKRFNANTKPGDKKLNLLRISLDDPSKTVSRYEELPDSYKTAFDDVYKNNGYSFKVAKDIKTIPEIKNDVVSNPEKFAKNLGRPNAPRLYLDASLGFGNLMESIGEDFKQGKYGKGSFKTLGVLSIPVAGYFAQEEFRKGDPVLDVASSFLTGFKPTESIARTFVSEEKGGYTDAEKLARAQLQLLNNPPKTSMDMSPLLFLSQKDPEFTGSPNEYLPYLESKREGIESLAMGAEKRFQEQIMDPMRAEKARDRGTLIEGIKTLFNPYQFGSVNPNMQLAFQTGGRVGFADGPDDPSKRKFMKILGGLTALPFVGKFFKVAERAAPLVNKIKTPDAVGKPEWFDVLVNKVIEKGTDMTKQFATKEREIVYGTKISDDEYVRVVQDLDDDAVRIEYDSPTNVGQDTVVLQVKAGKMDEATGKKPRDEFYAAETEPRYVGGPEDADIEFDGENSGPGLMFIESDVSNLKQFATGKKLTKEEAAKAEKRKEFVTKINEDDYEAAQHLSGKYGDGPDIDYDDFE